MRVLVIPDVHLKPWMFEQAAVLMREKKADRAVCLMDIPDDWGKEYDIALYEQTYDAAIDFAKEFPETAWCYGNHDLSYLGMFFISFQPFRFDTCLAFRSFWGCLHGDSPA